MISSLPTVATWQTPGAVVVKCGSVMAAPIGEPKFRPDFGPQIDESTSIVWPFRPRRSCVRGGGGRGCHGFSGLRAA
jgi:hypothetical protein